jgi:hypothetical protein
MPSYATFTTPRTTIPDPVALRLAVQAATGDPTAVLYNLGEGWKGKKAAAWTAGDLSATQTALDTTAALTQALSNQQIVDAMPMILKAVALALVDQLNVIRAALPVPLAAITVPQAIAAIRAKAGTL